MLVLEYYHERFFKFPKSSIGIEIESEGDGCSRIRSPGWSVKRDGSLRGEGVELISEPTLAKRVPALLKSLAADIKHYTDEAVAEWKPSERCGVHVHINCQHMQIEDVYKVIVCYFILEDLLIKYCGASREGNLFCLSGRDAEFQIDRLCASIEQNRFNILVDNHLRYSALNTACLGQFGTLEFRALQTPEDVTKIGEWVSILQALKTEAIKFETLRQMIEQTSMLGPVAFVRQILGQHADAVLCPDAERLVMEGVRRVQDVAYIRRADAPERAKMKIERLIVGDMNVQPRARPVPQHVAEQAEIRLQRDLRWAELFPAGRMDVRPGAINVMDGPDQPLPELAIDEELDEDLEEFEMEDDRIDEEGF